MGWIKVSDDFYDNEKFAEVGALGMALWVAALGYCNRNMTDGLIPKSKAYGLVDFSNLAIETARGELCGALDTDCNEWAIDSLLVVDLWHETGHDCPSCVDPGPRKYVVHDYLDFQPSKADIEAKSEANKRRVEEWRKRNGKGEKVGNAASNGVGNGVTNDVRTDDVRGLYKPPNPNPNPNPNVVFSSSSLGEKTTAAVARAGDVTSGTANDPPPPGNGDPNNPRCPQHSNIPGHERGPNCRACKNHRRWLAEQPQRTAEAHERASEDARVRQRLCPHCDDFGWILGIEPVMKCTHEIRAANA